MPTLEDLSTRPHYPSQELDPNDVETFVLKLRRALAEAGLCPSGGLQRGPGGHNPASAVQLWHLSFIEGHLEPGRLSAMGVPEPIEGTLLLALGERARLSRAAAHALIVTLDTLAYKCWPAGVARTPEG